MNIGHIFSICKGSTVRFTQGVLNSRPADVFCNNALPWDEKQLRDIRKQSVTVVNIWQQISLWADEQQNEELQINN
jgi:hypothetical protein